MSDSTVASRVNRLLQKSRQAYRIYSAMSKNAKAEGNFYSELQANEWMKANADLIRQLSLLVEERSLKNLHQNLSRIRFHLEEEYSKAESTLESEQNDLIACSKRGDFIRCAQLSTGLISKKGYIQATRAAAHELQIICGDSSTNRHKAAVENQLSQPPAADYKQDFAVTLSDKIGADKIDFAQDHLETNLASVEADNVFYQNRQYGSRREKGSAAAVSAKVIQLRR